MCLFINNEYETLTESELIQLLVLLKTVIEDNIYTDMKQIRNKYNLNL